MNDIVSIIIPARNEKYLERTIRDILENARGEIEIIAILDGYLPEPKIDIGDDRVSFHHFETSIGQRQSVNYGAKVAKGDYIMKLDAHCSVAEGFDVQLVKDHQYDWTVVPRMYNLDIETWKPKLHKRTDYMYFSAPDDPEKPFRAQYYGSKQPKNSAEIDDTMCCMGPGWFMSKARFWELGGMDEGHGSWGQMGIEVALKAWLSGGSFKVNKRTWFTHWFRGGSGPGFPYHITGRDQDIARKYSQDLWLNDKWPLATRKLEWVINKFDPPGWENWKKTKNMKMKPAIYKPRRARSYLHGTSMEVDNLIQNIDAYFLPNDPRIKEYDTLIRFLQDLNSGEHFDMLLKPEELRSHPYYDCIIDLRDSVRLELMTEYAQLFFDIKENGFKYPIEMYVDNGKYIIHKGAKRLAVAYALGIKTVSVKIYKDQDSLTKFSKLPDVLPDTINSIAQKQFQTIGSEATDKYWVHNYLVHYDAHIGNLRDSAKKIIELGVQKGPSALLWREAFPSAQIYGVDIDISDTSLIKDADRITLLKGSQSDPNFIKTTVVPNGPFDIVIDDASHRPEDQKASFDLLWESVAEGGWYIVEDLFYRNYFGSSSKNNMMSKLYKLVDEMNLKCEIEAVHFYYNICFIQKMKHGKSN